MNKDDSAYVLLMRDSFRKIREFAGTMTYEQFMTDQKTQSAILMQLQVIGELAKKMPEVIKGDINAPWKQMAGLRDVVAHNYFSLDLATVWHTIKEGVPQVEVEVEAYLKKSALRE